MPMPFTVRCTRCARRRQQGPSRQVGGARRARLRLRGPSARRRQGSHVLTFPAALAKDATVPLRLAGSRFNKVPQDWEGLACVEEAEKLAAAHGGSACCVMLSVPPPPAPVMQSAADPAPCRRRSRHASRLIERQGRASACVARCSSSRCWNPRSCCFTDRQSQPSAPPPNDPSGALGRARSAATGRAYSIYLPTAAVYNNPVRDTPVCQHQRCHGPYVRP